MIFDVTRGSRSDSKDDPVHTTSVALMKPLIRDSNSNKKSPIGIYLYHPPAVSGLYEKYLPKRFNELPGVHHIKTYLFDNDLVVF